LAGNVDGGRAENPHDCKDDAPTVAGVAPAIRYSALDPEFEGGSPLFPLVATRWDWKKIDWGIRLGILDGIDLTAELSQNESDVIDTGETEKLDELLVTLRWSR
jgi:hypothetical protein